MSLLEVRGLQVAYGGIRAVKGVDFDVGEGELVSLIGANGAGKSSTLRALSGLLAAGGSVTYAGEVLADRPAFARARAGLVMVPEGRGVFPALSVDENLSVGAYSRGAAGDALVERDRERVFGLFPRLAERRRQAGGTLSGGEQQMLAIGRALMSRPKLLLLDEPSMGLAPLVVQTIFSVIRTIHAEGVAVLLVEQNARAALELASRAYVMDSGSITLSGAAGELLHDPRVKAAYLGESGS
jgi:branched-chain amino acid transport system ATP-binding protein